MVAGRAKPAALAGKGQQVLMLAMVAPNPGETALQVATRQKLMHHLGDDASEHTVARLVRLGSGSPINLVAYHGNWYLLALNAAAERIETILSWMPHVKVLAPGQLRDRVRQRLRQGLARCG
jgi:hypothetical protein